MIEKDVRVLQAEVVALQAVLMSVFRRMVKRNPELAPTFCEAFDEAETILSGVAEKLGVEAPLDTTIGALQVIEELRKAVISDESACS
jgi:hypothetical protein